MLSRSCGTLPRQSELHKRLQDQAFQNKPTLSLVTSPLETSLDCLRRTLGISNPTEGENDLKHLKRHE